MCTEMSPNGVEYLQHMAWRLVQVVNREYEQAGRRGREKEREREREGGAVQYIKSLGHITGVCLCMLTQSGCI